MGGGEGGGRGWALGRGFTGRKPGGGGRLEGGFCGGGRRDWVELLFRKNLAVQHEKIALGLVLQ